jgi:hypothetical protein
MLGRTVANRTTRSDSAPSLVAAGSWLIFLAGVLVAVWGGPHFALRGRDVLINPSFFLAGGLMTIAPLLSIVSTWWAALDGTVTGWDSRAKFVVFTGIAQMLLVIGGLITYAS